MIKLKKTSANEAVSSGSSCYSLKGAVYTVYSDEGCTKAAYALTTGDDGAEFTVRFYAGQYTKDNLSAQATRTWVFKTNEDGVAVFKQSYLVSGDELWTNSNGVPTLPLGTVSIQETKAPTGYLLTDTSLRVQNITAVGTAETVRTFVEPDEGHPSSKQDSTSAPAVMSAWLQLFDLAFEVPHVHRAPSSQATMRPYFYTVMRFDILASATAYGNAAAAHRENKGSTLCCSGRPTATNGIAAGPRAAHVTIPISVNGFEREGI